MTASQSVIKYCAIALAMLLSVAIIGSLIMSAAGAFALLGGKRGVGEMKTYEISGNIKTLEIEIGAAELNIRTGDRFSVESNLDKLKVTEKDGVLKISEKKRLSVTYNGKAELNICIPQGTEFEKFVLDAGAGTVKIESISAEKVSLDLGAGKTAVGRLSVSGKAEINGGAGKIDIADGRINELAADIGAGSITLTGTLTGKCALDVGVGKAEIILNGGFDAYRFSVNKGIGDITVGGKSMSDGQEFGSGENLIGLDSGIGSITVSFAD